MRPIRKTRLALLMLTAGAASYPALGYTVVCNVTSSAPISLQVMPQLTAANTTLGAIQTTLINIGTAISQQGDRSAALINQTADNQRQFDIEQRRQERIREAKARYRVASDVCATAVSGGMGAASNAAGGGKRTLASSSSNKQVKQAYDLAFKDPSIEATASATTHKAYCDTNDKQAYGGTEFCQTVSDMPRGDTSLSSVLDGAGKEGKKPTLTFTDEQTDAALLYTKNTAQRSAGRAPSRAEVKSASGRQYLGMFQQYQAYIDAAAQPQLEMIAASKPNPATKQPLDDARKVPSMATFYDQNVSEEAKRKGMMSLREFEQFEVSRRYANPAYQTDLMMKNSDDLLREQVNVTNLNSWLLYGLKQQVEKNNILQGQMLALMAQNEYAAKMQSVVSQMNQSVAKQ